MTADSLLGSDGGNGLEDDKIRQVWAFNKKPPPTANECIHTTIASRNASQPEKVVVQAWDGTLTFAQLDELSTRLAGHLASLGVGPEVIVPICFEKSMWTVVAMLGVLKAGGAFTLIDPGLPEERVRGICLRVRARTAVTSVTCRALLSGLAENIVVLDWKLSEQPFSICPVSQPSPADAAYVIFTSGSTGQPKGCVIEHRAFCSAALGHGSILNVNQDTRSLQFSSYAFGVCLVDILTTLIVGGCVCIPSEEERSVNNLPAAIRKLNANWVLFTPSTLAHIRPEDVPSLQTIVLGGEPVQISQIKEWSSRVHLRHGYGCAEACVAMSALQLNETSATSDVGHVTTGRCWMVDETDINQLVPVGVPGELIFEGTAMGREYIDEPEETSRAFIQAPSWRASFGPCEAASRFYKTGDLAVFKPDGSVQLLGRKDTQIKLNGQRIEVGEIEHQVKLSTSVVKDVAVECTILNNGNDRGPGLIGFLVLEEDEAKDKVKEEVNTRDTNVQSISQVSYNSRAITAIQSVQAKLQRVLPYYMVPSVLVVLPSLPKTPTGKIFRKQLREIVSAMPPHQLAKLRSFARGDMQKPRTEQEHCLRKLWSQALKLDADSIGIDDNFFHLGGDSKAAIRLVGAANSIGLAMAVADVFRKPVLSAMAQIQSINIKTGPEVQPIMPFSLLRDDRPAADVCKELSDLCSVDRFLIEDAYPCTPMQEGLLSLSSKGVGDYIQQVVLEMSDDVELDPFRAAWEHVIRSTAILRTRIVQHPRHGLVQVVCQDGVNWTRHRNLEDYLCKDKLTPMALGGRMSRYALVEDSKTGSRRFVWTLHHSIYDGWSLPHIIDMVVDAYSNKGTKKRPEFNAFIKHVISEASDDGEAYWRSYLEEGDFSPFPCLSTSSREPAADSSLELKHKLSPGRTTEMTTSTLIRGALAILISRYTASKDVVFGAVLSGRNAPVASIEDIIGPTITTVPVRIKLEPDQSVQRYLQEVQQQATDMIPFEQMGLKRIAKINRSSQSGCNFQTLLAVQPESSIKAGGTLGQWRLSSTQPSVTTYALGLECFIDKEEVTVKAIFDTAVMGVWQAEHMLRQLDLVLTQLEGASPEKMVSDVEALTDVDEKVIWAWNQRVPSAANRLLHDLISEQVLATPEAPALCGMEGNLTFRELEAASTRLAFHLGQLGVSLGALVPICFEKSIWAVVAIIGVLKAGAAFVPLDPEQPFENRWPVLEMTQASMVLTSKSYSSLPLPPGCKSFVVNENSLAGIPEHSINLVPSGAGPDSTAYVIFTSGTTGQPKGVVIQHRAISSSCLSHGPVYGISPTSRVLQFASYTFDACLFEIIMTLIHGGCVCVPSEEQRLGDLASTMRDMSVNTAFLTPTVAQAVQPENVPALHTLIMGGEAVTKADFDRWDRVSKLFNGYGPTETTVIAVVDSYERYAVGNNRIGKAVGCATWVVDPWDENRLAPLGAIGELFIESPSLAREYLADPVATAAAFVNDPTWLLRGCGNSSGRKGRLYKTGDLVRYNQDGSLSFIGRKDSRLKIRGQWLDVAKVEHQVRKCMPSGTQAIAEVIELVGAKDKKMLAVFIQAAGKEDDGKRENNMVSVVLPVVAGIEVVRLRPELESALSRSVWINTVSMVYFRVAHFPVMASGKTDRRRLREMGAMLSSQQLMELQAAAGKGNQQPRTEVERLLQHAWAQVLNIEYGSIGIDDNFFHLGGDSITAMQVSAVARASLVDVSTTDILHKRTIAMIALTAKSLREGPVMGIDQGNEKNDVVAFDLSPIQKLYVQHETNHIRYFDQHFFLKLSSPVQYACLKKAMETVVSRHPMLRARFSQTSAGKWEQRIVDDVSSSLHMCQSNSGSSETEKALAIRRCRETVNIEKGPLVAAVVFNDADATSIFISIHHMVIDLVSWRILLQELECLLSSSGPPLPQTLSFQAWCKLQAQYAANNLEYLRSAPEASVVPPLLSYWGLNEHLNTQGETKTTGFTLDESTSAAILGRCNNAFATRPVELMISALVYSFNATFTDRPTPTVFSEGHGREPWDDNLDVSRTIGWFTTLWPVQVQSSACGSLLHTTRQVKDAIRGLSQNGWAYFTSRFANEEDARANARDFPVEVIFNYAGSFQQFERSGSLFDPLTVPSGCHPPAFSGLKRFALFDVVATANSDCLHIYFVYSTKSLHQDRILAWVEQYQTELKQLVNILCDRPLEWTLADFPMAFKSYDAIVCFRGRLMPQLGIPHTGDIEDIYPCSPIQEKILKAQDQDVNRSRIFFDFEITASDDSGGVNLARVEQAWRAVVQKHPLLRAMLVDGTPGSDGSLNIILRDPILSLSYIRAGDEAAEKRGCPDEPAPIPYKRNGLQHHLTVRQVNEKHVTLHFEMNHAILDGHSIFKVLLDDFRQAYAGRLDAMGAPYSRFVRYIGQQSWEANHAYWMKYLDTAEPCLIFNPSDAKRSRSDIVLYVPGLDIDMINSFCARWELTKATIVQAAWAMVLKMYLGCSVSCFGMYTSGRDIPVKDVDRIFGPLMCLMPRRIQLDGHGSVVETLRGIHEDYVRSLPHQTHPVADMCKALDIGPPGLFNTTLSYQRGKVVDAEAESGHSCRFGEMRTYSGFDISIQARDHGTAFTVILLLKPGFISDSEATTLASDFGAAIRYIISNPEKTMGEIDFQRPAFTA
ncbi:Nonribosomal peptide synthetase [Metarhizium acridum]|nr:Nonribosomal peptide synthetase [Metarhizium acridum]